LQAKLHTHITTTKSLTFTESLTFRKHKTQTKRPKPKIVRTANYNCAYVMIMAVLIGYSCKILDAMPYRGKDGKNREQEVKLRYNLSVEGSWWFNILHRTADPGMTFKAVGEEGVNKMS